MIIFHVYLLMNLPACAVVSISHQSLAPSRLTHLSGGIVCLLCFLRPAPAPVQTCTDTPQGSTCGPCPRGYTAVGPTATMCVDTNGCSANPKQPGSLTPCFSGVPCADVPAALDTLATGRGDFVCAGCPVGYAGNGTSCSPCTLSASIPGASFAGSTALRASPLSFFGAGAFPPRAANGFACASNPPGGITFAWFAEPRPLTPGGTVSAAGSAVPDAVDQLLGLASLNPNLEVPAKALPVRTSWTFTLRTCYSGSRNAALCGTAQRNVTIASSPLVPFVTGGNAVVSLGAGAVVLDASGSYDPDDEPGAISYSWSCEQQQQQGGAQPAACMQPDGGGPVTAGLGPGGGPQLALLLAGVRNPAEANYTVRLRIAKSGGQRAVSTSVWVAVSDTRVRLPRISLRVAPARGTRVNPSDKIVLTADTVSADPPSLTTTWSVVSPPSLALGGGSSFLEANAATPLTANSPALVLNPNSLPPGTEVVVRFTATNSEGTAFADLPLTASAAPRGGRIVVSPPVGAALETVFNFTAVDWTRGSPDLPLEYSFLYQVVGGPPVPTGAGGNFFTASPFSFSPTLLTTLPAGIEGSGYRINCTVQARRREAFWRLRLLAFCSCNPSAPGSSHLALASFFVCKNRISAALTFVPSLPSRHRSARSETQWAWFPRSAPSRPSKSAGATACSATLRG